MTVLFISDLHLDETRPRVTEAFLAFLANEACQAEALYILGDLFEAWIGDDDPSPHHARVADAIKKLTASGIPCRFMHGNRDFLIGSAFAARTGVEILSDPTVQEIDGVPTLLMHGDTLCTDDLEYQKFRTLVRDPRWQREFLARPIEERRAFAERARAESRAQTANKALYLMDVNQRAVEDALRRHGVTRLIHGHTHRPAVHRFALDGVECTRIVLGDWYEQGSVLRCERTVCRLENLPIISP